MANITYTFKRYEKKYLLNKYQYQRFKEMTKKEIVIDDFGKCEIRNIYFDNDSNELTLTSLSKPNYKEKLRMRCYNDDYDNTFLEIKKKVNGIVYKRRDKFKLDDAKSIINNIDIGYNSQVLNEIKYMINHYNLRSALYLGYSRIAFKGIRDPNFRLTIDTNIRYRNYDLDIRKDYGEYLLKEDEYLMEIKVFDAMPIWLTDVLNELKIYPVSFSKYTKIYEKENLNKMEELSCFKVSLQMHQAV